MARKKQLYPGIEQAEQQKGKTSYNSIPDYEKNSFKSEEEYLEKVFNWTQEKILVWFNID